MPGANYHGRIGDTEAFLRSKVTALEFKQDSQPAMSKNNTNFQRIISRLNVAFYKVYGLCEGALPKRGVRLSS